MEEELSIVQYENITETRFLDYDELGRLRVSACLSLFENARFLLTKKTQLHEKISHILNCEKILFPVVDLNLTVEYLPKFEQDLIVRSSVESLQGPLIIFTQTLMDCKKETPCITAKIKVAILDAKEKRIKTLNKIALDQINDTIANGFQNCSLDHVYSERKVM